MNRDFEPLATVFGALLGIFGPWVVSSYLTMLFFGNLSLAGAGLRPLGFEQVFWAMGPVYLPILVLVWLIRWVRKF